ncbi:MAG: DUF6607 family protein [Pseudomonadota bacterium]
MKRRLPTSTARLTCAALSLCLPPAAVIASDPAGVGVAPARDREAILAMRGEYAVRFAFDETVVLAPGYERRPAQRSGGDEAVIVVEDSPGRIVLQHILVDARSGHVTKHWRQDWIYEAPTRFEFSADQTWTVRAIPAATTRGAWTQCVYEVSDAPRYCGTGRWTHDDGIAMWTGDASWRPLPRREHVKRDDYNALLAVNRHTLTPDGWTHEQFNTKVQRGVDGVRRALVREFGFNDYRRTRTVDFGPAHRYWERTARYWARVRARWDAALAGGGLRLRAKVDGMALIAPLFEQAGAVDAGKPVDDAGIDAVFAQWVAPSTSEAASR